MKENELLTKLNIQRKYIVFLQETREYSVEVEACSEKEAIKEIKSDLDHYLEEASLNYNDKLKIKVTDAILDE